MSRRQTTELHRGDKVTPTGSDAPVGVVTHIYADGWVEVQWPDGPTAPDPDGETLEAPSDIKAVR